MARSPGTKRQTEPVAAAGRLDWAGLAALWSDIQRRRTSGWAQGRAMEHLVLRAFQLGGAEVVWPYSVSIDGLVVEQIDGMVVQAGITCMIECKDLVTDVNIEPLAKLRNQLMRRPAGVVGSVFSSSGFTDPAKTLARFMAPHAILLWQGPEIAHRLRVRDFNGALEAKLRRLIQHGNPDFDTRALESDP